MSKAENNVYRVKTDGFHGELFLPVENKYPGKALICFSGSDGKFGRICRTKEHRVLRIQTPELSEKKGVDYEQ